MKRLIVIFFSILILGSCIKTLEKGPDSECYPEGTVVTMHLAFSTPDFLDVKIGTKAEASPADESRVRELYVMLFDEQGNKFYGRNFSYSQKAASLSDLEASEHDSWYVETNASDITTRGVVKLSTVSKPNCTLIVLANVSNTISHIGTATKVVDYLAGITTLGQLKAAKVTLEQDIVTRSDLFLMMGTMEAVNTGSLKWGILDSTYYTAPEYNEGTETPVGPGKPYQVELKTLDVKIKFRVKYNKDNTSYIDPNSSYSRNWKVYNVPTSCYLFQPLTAELQASSSDGYFDTEEAFFDGTEVDENHDSWEVFTFYMLENFQSGTGAANYYDREKQEKTPITEGESAGYVENGAWINAPENGTYVWFDMVLGLTSDGVTDIVGPNNIAQAITSKAAFTVHLGDFSTYGYNDYTVKRNHCYTYNVTIVNTRNIYLEVDSYDPAHPEAAQTEDQPGQEGSLLLVTEGIVNCDSHYEYHDLTFEYDKSYLNSGISWYVKTPFSAGGEGECKDYLWVKFAVNDIINDSYTEARKSYPINDGTPGWVAYDPEWDPTSGAPRPPLMDIKQLVKYLINETAKETNNPGSSDYRNRIIHVTAFVDEYYYEFDPRDYQPSNVEELTTLLPAPNPELWRQFVNQPPRELHILSNTRFSQDRNSDVIESNNSIIQQSIQSFYNIYSPDLTSLWGTEHLDEMEFRTRFNKLHEQVQWPWWPLESEGYFNRAISSNPNDAENGRINTVKIWNLPLDGSAGPSWGTFLDYDVNNNTPELKSGWDATGQNYNSNNDYKFLAYSCLTRNRDNNFNGVIDPEEVRWYTASINQLVGMWVGNESLTPSARLYHPMDASNKADGTKWRSWVISSTSKADMGKDPYVIRAEEGCTRSYYSFYDWAFGEGEPGQRDRNKVSSIRCVRNIGTYQDGGTLKDISYAPYDRMVDQYYEFPAGADQNGKVNKNTDGTYTIRFSRLNPKSIREYTADDLPYHDEFSIHNCVYQELIVQDEAVKKYEDGNSTFPATYDGKTLDEEVINDAVTAQGHNYYCPDGYRIPNMTELLLMESLLKSSFWGNAYFYPCRTYFTHGALGSDQVDSENEKVGWVKHESRVYLADQGSRINGIRCVRDESRTGVITGAISVDDADRLRHSTDAEDRYMNLHLNISSLGSAINSLDISLVYISSGGMEETISVTPADLTINGVTVRKEVQCKIPKYDELPILGNITVRVSVMNRAVSTPTVFETPITLLSPVFTSIRLLHCNYDEDAENPPFPVMVTASSAAPITAMSLKIVNPDEITTTVPLFSDASSTEGYKSLIYQYNYRTNLSQGGTAPLLVPGTYTFQLEAVSGGKTTRSEAATMEVLQVDYWPNYVDPSLDPDDPGYPWAEASDFTNKWEAQHINHIDFYAGDFIEANMDVSSCKYKPNPGTFDRDRAIGRDNLISVGITGTDEATGMTVPNIYHIYFPAHDGNVGSGQDWLRPNIARRSGNNLSNGYNYKHFTADEGTGFLVQLKQQDIELTKPNINTQQHFRLEQRGAYWNDQLIDLDKWNAADVSIPEAKASLQMILDANSLYVGSTQGYHRSRAGYMFVRVVHNGSSKNSIGSNTHFTNPNNGGNL